MNRLRYLRHPLFGHIVVQSAFWLLINVSFAVYSYLFFSSIETLISVPGNFNFWAMLIGVVIVALIQGVVLGITNYFISRLFFILKSLWKIVVLHILASMGAFSLTFLVFINLVTHTALSDGMPFIHQLAGTLDHFFPVALFHSFIGSMIAGLGVQVIKKYGRDVFVPMLFGFYKEPKEEKRIFMFMDLKSSTSIAERLGHIRYSAFIQDFILDVNQCLDDYNANAHQYVGDEVVLTWRCSKEHLMCSIGFVFACRDRIEKRKTYYLAHYGNVPQFKVGAECGIVTAVEIGDIKRDIAYHGDTLNTAARIQAMCNELDCSFLVSGKFVEELGEQIVFQIKSLGLRHLKGKDKPIELFAISSDAR